MLLSVFNLLQTVCSEARVARELASQLYSDVKGSNPISRLKKNTTTLKTILQKQANENVV